MQILVRRKWLLRAKCFHCGRYASTVIYLAHEYAFSAPIISQRRTVKYSIIVIFIDVNRPSTLDALAYSHWLENQWRTRSIMQRHIRISVSEDMKYLGMPGQAISIAIIFLYLWIDIRHSLQSSDRISCAFFNLCECENCECNIYSAHRIHRTMLFASNHIQWWVISWGIVCDCHRLFS